MSTGNLQGFNAHNVAPAQGFQPIPAGTYRAVIAASSMKETKAKTGMYLELKFQIVDGPHKGKPFWDRLNIHNPNPVAVEIAKGQLSAICHAVGVMTPNDSSELHGRPMLVELRQVTRQGSERPDNEVVEYKRIPPSTGQAPLSVPQQPFAQQPVAPQQQQAGEVQPLSPQDLENHAPWS